MSRTVSVIVPAYNIERDLPRCIESLLAQTYSDLEIVLVDDGSSDGTGAVCEDYSLRDQRILVLHKENGGVSSARNMGLEVATGEYVSIVDGDDWLEPHAYAFLCETAQTHGADVVFFEYFVNNIMGNECRHRVDSILYGVLDRETAIWLQITAVHAFSWSKLFTRKAISDIRFREEIHWGEDSLFVCDVLGNADSIYFTDRPLYHYVQSENSATRMAVNPKRLSGLAMAEGMIDMCRQRYPRLEVYAHRMLIGIATQLLYEYISNGITDESTVSMLRARLRRSLPRVRFSPRIAIRQRLKFVIAAVSPLCYCRLHDATLRRQGESAER